MLLHPQGVTIWTFANICSTPGGSVVVSASGRGHGLEYWPYLSSDWLSISLWGIMCDHLFFLYYIFYSNSSRNNILSYRKQTFIYIIWYKNNINKHTYNICYMYLQGPAFFLEDGRSAIAVSEALMWAKCTPFSPLCSGVRINPF